MIYVLLFDFPPDADAGNTDTELSNHVKGGGTGQKLNAGFRT